MAQIANVWVNILPETSKIAPGVKKALGGLDPVAEASGKSMGGRITGALGKSMKLGGVAAFASAGGLMATAMAKGLGRLNSIESAQAKLTGLGNSAETVGAIMSDALASVKGTAHGMGEAASTAASLVASGITPGQELKGVLETIGSTAAIMGRSMDDVGLIFGSVAARGKLMGDDLNQLRAAGVPVIQMLATELGKTNEEISDMVSKGQVDFATFEKAMKAGVGDAAQQMGNTVSGSFANVGAALGRLGAMVQGPVFAAMPPLLNAVGGAFDSFGKGLKPAAEAIGGLLTPMLEQLAGKIEGFSPLLEQAGQKVGEWALKLAEVAVDPAVWAAVGEAFSRVGDVAERLWPALESLGSSLATIASSISVATWTALGEVLNAVAPVLTSVLVPALEQFAVFAQENPGLVQAMVVGFLGFKAVGAVAGPIGQVTGAVSGAHTAFGTLSALFKVGGLQGGFKALGSFAGSGVPVLGKLGTVVTSVSRVFGSFAGVFARVATVAAPLLKTILGFVAGLNPWVLAITAAAAALTWFFTQTELGRKVWSALVDGFRTGVDFVKAAFSGLVEAWGTVMGVLRGGDAGQLVDVFGSFGLVIATVKTNLTTLWEGLKTGFQVAVQVVQFGWETIKTVFTTAWENLKTVVSAGWETIKTVFATAFLAITSLLRGDFEGFKQVIAAGLAKVRQIWADAGDAIRARIHDAFEYVKNAAGNMWQRVKGLFVEGVGRIIAKAQDLRAEVAKKFSEMVEESTNYVRDLPGKIQDFFVNAKNWLKDAGVRIITGLLDGMKQKWEDIRSWVADKASSVANWFTGAEASAREQVGLSTGGGYAMADGGVVRFYAHGGVRGGRRENHVAQLARAGEMRVWAEPETGGEAYIPLAKQKRVRSTAILGAVADQFGYTLVGSRDGVPYGGGYNRRLGDPNVRFFADGGISASHILRFARGQKVNGQQARRPLEGAPYVWGGLNWGDCSGAMSALARFAVGARAFASRFATGNQRQALAALGFRSGRGNPATDFTIGWFNGGPWGGHTSATVAGTNLEMGGGRGNGQIGGRAASAFHRQYTDHAHLKLASAMPLADLVNASAGFGKSSTDGGAGSITSTSVGSTKFSSGSKQVNVSWGSAQNLYDNMLKWGLHKRTRLYDSGGWLPHGGFAHNLSGKPEPVLTASQWGTVGQMLSSMPSLVEAIEELVVAFNGGDFGYAATATFVGDEQARQLVTAVADLGEQVEAAKWRIIEFGQSFGGEFLGAFTLVQDAERGLADSRKSFAEEYVAIAEAEAELRELKSKASREELDAAGQMAKAERDLAKARKGDKKGRTDANRIADAEERLRKTRAKVPAQASDVAEKIAKAEAKITEARERTSTQGERLVAAQATVALARYKSAFDVGKTVVEGLKNPLGAVKSLAALTGNPAIGLAVEAVEFVIETVDNLIQGFFKAREAAWRSYAEHFAAVAEMGRITEQHKQAVVSLGQAMVNARLDQLQAFRDMRLAQLDVTRAQLEGAKTVASAEAKLKAERERAAAAAVRAFDDLSLGLGRYIDVERQGWADRLNAAAIVTPEILALEQEVNAAKLGAAITEREAVLKALDATVKHQLAVFDLHAAQTSLRRAAEDFARASGKTFGVSTEEALVRSEVAKLIAENAKIAGQRNSLGQRAREAGGWVLDKLTFGLVKTPSYTAGQHLDAAVAQNNARIRELVGAHLGRQFDFGELDEVIGKAAALFAVGNNNAAEALLSSSKLFDGKRQLEALRFDQQLAEVRRQREDAEVRAERARVEVDQRERRVPLEDEIRRLQAGVRAAGYAAEAHREQSPAVREALLALRDFEHRNAKSRVVEVRLPDKRAYTQEDVDAILAAVGEAAGLEARVTRLEGDRTPGVADVLRARMG